MDSALVKAAIDPLVAWVPPTLLVVVALSFAALWRRLALREADAQAKRIASLESAVSALVADAALKSNLVTWDGISPRLTKLHTKANDTQSDLESLDSVLVATGVLKQPVVVRRRAQS